MEAERYVLAGDVGWEPRGSHFILGGGAGVGLFCANQSTIELLELADGARTVEDMVREVVSRHPGQADEVTAAAYEGIADLVERQLLVPSDRQRPAQPKKVSNLQRFSHLFIETTWRCNLRCKHCYMEGGNPRPTGVPDELPASHVCNLIDEFAALGGRFLTISGGEPLLHPHWSSFLRQGARQGLGLSLMTNGTYLDQATLNTLQNLRVTIGLGLDGITADTHDANRGRGSFQETMAALDLLAVNGHQAYTTLCFTPMRFNVYDLPGVIDMALQRGIPRLYVSLLESRGRALSLSERVEPTEEQRAWLMTYLYGKSLQLAGALDIELTHHVELFRHMQTGVRPGEHSKSRLTIRVASEGDVFMSAYMGAPEHAIGRLGESSLGEMLESEQASAILAAWDSRLNNIPKCQKCVYRAICKGGSGVLSYSSHGTFNEPDDYCGARMALFQALVSDQQQLVEGEQAL